MGQKEVGKRKLWMKRRRKNKLWVTGQERVTREQGVRTGGPYLMMSVRSPGGWGWTQICDPPAG